MTVKGTLSDIRYRPSPGRLMTAAALYWPSSRKEKSGVRSIAQSLGFAGLEIHRLECVAWRSGRTGRRLCLDDENESHGRSSSLSRTRSAIADIGHGDVQIDPLIEKKIAPFGLGD